MREIHVIATGDSSGSALAESPQIPGFVMVRDSMNELARDLREVLRGIVSGPAQIVIHHQWRAETPDGASGLLYRAQDGPSKNARIDAATFIQASIANGYRAELSRPGILGDVLVIGCVAADTLGMIADQITDDDGVPMVALRVEGGAWIVSLESADEEHTETLDRGMTIAEYVAYAQRVARRPLALVAAN